MYKHQRCYVSPVAPPSNTAVPQERCSFTSAQGLPAENTTRKAFLSLPTLSSRVDYACGLTNDPQYGLIIRLTFAGRPVWPLPPHWLCNVSDVTDVFTIKCPVLGCQQSAVIPDPVRSARHQQRWEGGRGRAAGGPQGDGDIPARSGTGKRGEHDPARQHALTEARPSRSQILSFPYQRRFLTELTVC